MANPTALDVSSDIRELREIARCSQPQVEEAIMDIADRLVGHFEAAEQHVKILREQRDSQSRPQTSKPDLANHVRVYTGRLFYDGSYTDEQRWVKAEFFEALRERLTAETKTPHYYTPREMLEPFLPILDRIAAGEVAATEAAEVAARIRSALKTGGES